MSRVPLLTTEDAAAAAMSVELPVSLSELNVFRVLLQHPRLAVSIRNVFAAIREGKLDPRVRELVILRIAWRMGSEYQWSHHWRTARMEGATRDETTAIRDWRVYDGFGAVERAALAATDETLDRGRVSDTTWAQCVEHFATFQEQLELVSTIGIYGMVAHLVHVLEIPLDEAVKPWPPDGRRPGLSR